VADTQTTRKEAEELLISQLYVPAFFQKLAEYGVQPQSQAQADSLLRQAQLLRQATAADMAKQAAAIGDPLLIAEQRLAERLGQLQPGVAEGLAMNKFAADIVQNRPDLAQAALTYQNAAAQAMIAQQSR
jgi:hypothetical protein